MIEVTLSELIDSASVMRELANKPMKTKVAFQTARLIREIEKEYNLFQESRNKLITQYGAKDESGNLKIDENNNYSIEPTHIIDFNKELNEMLNQTLSLNVEPIKLDDLGETDFTPNDMVLLQPFVIE